MYRCLYLGTSAKEFLNGIWQHMFLRSGFLSNFEVELYAVSFLGSVLGTIPVRD